MSDSQSAARGKLPLATKILLGLLAGAIAGVACNVAFAPAYGAEPSAAFQRVTWFANRVANPVGQVFLRLLFMVVVPLVFCSLVTGIASLGDLRRLGRMGARTIAWFLGTTALAVALGLVLVNAFEPGRGMDPAVTAELREQFSGQTAEKIAQAKLGTGFSIDTFVNIVPKNVLRSGASDSETLGIILFAILVGIAATRLSRERSRSFLEFLEAFNEICVTILGYAMALAPFGVAGLIFSATSQLGLPVLQALGSYLFVAMLGLVLHQFVVLGVLVRVFAGLNPLRFFARARGLMITAFSTSSSNATMPTTIRTAVDEFGAPQPIAGFVVPLGATMNMNGTALFEGVVVLFLAQVAGVDLSLGQQIVVVCLAVMTAIGAAGVPGGSLPLLSIVLVQVGVPPEMLALILGVDRLVDMTRTVPNVCSDLICSLWIARREGAVLKA